MSKPVTITLVTFARRTAEAHRRDCSRLATKPYQRPSTGRALHVVQSRADLAPLLPEHTDLTCHCMAMLPPETPTPAQRITALQHHIAESHLRAPLWPDTPQLRERLAELAELAAAENDTAAAAYAIDVAAAVDRLAELSALHDRHHFASGHRPPLTPAVGTYDIEVTERYLSAGMNEAEFYGLVEELGLPLGQLGRFKGTGDERRDIMLGPDSLGGDAAYEYTRDYIRSRRLTYTETRETLHQPKE